MDGEEIARVGQFLDEAQLVLDLLAHLRWNAFGIALRRALPGEMDEVLLRRAALRHDLVGIFVAQLAEAEAAALGELHRARHGLGIIAEQAPHLGFGLEMPLGMGVETEARLGDRAALADAGHDVLQHAPLRDVIEHVVGGEEFQAGNSSEIGEAPEALSVVAAIEMLRREIGVPAGNRRQGA